MNVLVLALLVAAPPDVPPLAFAPCEATQTFVSLAALAKRAPGPVAVRARVWRNTVEVCTTSIPEHCWMSFVLAAHKPREDREYLRIDATIDGVALVCEGDHLTRSCPIPGNGEWLGLTGTLVDATSMTVDTICRLRR